jgi:hypothetical protein
MDQVAALMKARMKFDESQVSATRYPESLSVSVVNGAVVPVTGAAIAGAETYGGQRVAHIDVKAGQTVTIPLP